MTTEHVPNYLAGANGDPLMVGIAITLIAIVLIGGVLYFKLHAVPEHIAHGKNHTQIQLISILTLLALFTHNNIFWFAALIVAVIKLPDFLSPLKSIARSLAVLSKSEKAKNEKTMFEKGNSEKNKPESNESNQTDIKENS